MRGSLKDVVECGEVCVRVTIVKAEGSTPRSDGAAMLVLETDLVGTIGGGALEFDATAHARKILDADPSASYLRDTKTYPLGPSLGQCCGGHVRVLFERLGEVELNDLSAAVEAGAKHIARPIVSGKGMTSLDCAGLSKSQREFLKAPLSKSTDPYCWLLRDSNADVEWFVERVAPDVLSLYLYGAGHIAREVVRVFEGMDVEIVWVDTDASRFPASIPAHAKRLIVATPHSAVHYAPDDAFHVVMTCSHPLDLDICYAALQRGAFRYLGLIGSQTKRARFSRRLSELGVPKETLARLTCPIGAGGPSGKEPAMIAIALAAEILSLSETQKAC